MEKLRVAIAGTGYFSRFHYDAWARCTDVQVVGVAGLDREETARCAQRFGVEAFGDVTAMLDAVSPDLIDVITPPSTHEALIAAAAERGVNIICQKPFCSDLIAAERAVQFANTCGVTLVVHENFRFQPWYRTIAQCLNQGRLGEIYQATFRLRPGDGQGPNAYMERQPYFQTMPRFLVHETAIHLIDVFRFLLGDVVALQADLVRRNPAISGEDSCLITLDFGDGKRGLIDGNRLADHRAENRRRTMGEMTIEGSKGTVTLNGDGEIHFRAHGSNDLESIPYEWNDEGFGGDCVYNLIRHVVACVLENRVPENTGAAYLANLRLEEAVYESAEQGRRISF